MFLGYPTPNITWYLEGRPFLSRPVGDIKRSQWNIKLERLLQEDSGNYQCRVCNHMGCINFTYVLEVTGERAASNNPTHFPSNTRLIFSMLKIFY